LGAPVGVALIQEKDIMLMFPWQFSYKEGKVIYFPFPTDVQVWNTHAPACLNPNLKYTLKFEKQYAHE
jgi:hypothetical protein